MDNHADRVHALRRLSVETGSLACLGCGYEHNCGIHGCAILREAAEKIEDLESQLAETRAHDIANTSSVAQLCGELSAIRAALHRAQPANEPLTLDELRGIDGEPVWCEDTTNCSGIIKLAEDWSTEKLEAHIWTFDADGNPKCNNVRLMMEFGAKFYLRKPEPEGRENG